LTPMPAGRPAARTGSKESPALTAGPKEAPPPAQPQTYADEQDRLAAMLLGMDDGEVPGGSTVIDLPAAAAIKAEAEAAAAGAKPDPKKPAAPTKEDTSSAASEILRKYMRRPR
ncbi:MAG: hypothetical protein K2X87_08980, partial [Gemmataceae bacterium]|nr:hypothetical protein [Gemmataceae bacterium]